MKLSSKSSVPACLRLYACVFLAAVSVQSVNSRPSIMSSNPVIKTVTDDFSQLAEGPYWDEENRVLYYVDAVQGDFKRLDPTTRAVQKINVGNTLVSIIIPFADEPNNFIISRYNQLLKLNWTSGNTSVIATLPPGPGGQERFNDAKCDPRGRLFIGTALEINGFVPNGGAFYRLDGNNLTELARGFTVSNGMAWSNDANHTKLFFNDSEGRKIYSFDYNIENGTISNQRVMIDVANSTDFVDGEYPDGMAIDEQGYIWVALWNGGRIVKIDTETARVVDDVRLPRTKTPSSLAIGDYEGKRGFFVTTALGSTPENERLDDGKILHISFEGGEIYKYRP